MIGTYWWEYVETEADSKPCAAPPPGGYLHRNWPLIKCNLLVGHPGSHEYHQADDVIFVWDENGG
jgi:hypothetical protein